MKQSGGLENGWANNYLNLLKSRTDRITSEKDAPGILLDLMSVLVVAMTTSNEDLPNHAKQIAIALARRGWFITPDFHANDFVRWQQLVEAGDDPGIEICSVKHFRNRVKKIELELKKLYPHRARIFRAAFDAHGKKNYLLSVPIFLMQADGICRDELRFGFFKKEKKKTGYVPKIASVVSNIKIPEWEKAFLEPLAVNLPIQTNTDFLESSEWRFNRHAILHGLVTNYGTEEISLKSISLLGCLAKNLSTLKGGKAAESSSLAPGVRA